MNLVDVPTLICSGSTVINCGDRRNVSTRDLESKESRFTLLR